MLMDLFQDVLPPLTEHEVEIVVKNALSFQASPSQLNKINKLIDCKDNKQS